MGVGILAAEECSVFCLRRVCLLGVHQQHEAQHIIAAVPWLGLSEDLETALHRKLCSETEG